MRTIGIGLVIIGAAALAAPAAAERVVPAAAGEISVPAHREGPRQIPDNPRTTPTTGTDVDGRGYVCRTMILRRQDGGVTKVRRCTD